MAHPSIYHLLTLLNTLPIYQLSRFPFSAKLASHTRGAIYEEYANANGHDGGDVSVDGRGHPI